MGRPRGRDSLPCHAGNLAEGSADVRIGLPCSSTPGRQEGRGAQPAKATQESLALPLESLYTLRTVKHDILKQYVTLRESLEQERAQVQARLTAIEAALGGGEIPTPTASVRRGPGRPKGSKNPTSAVVKTVVEAPTVTVGEVKAPRGKHKRTALARQRMAAAQKARWARIHAEKAGKAVVAAPTPVAEPKKRKKRVVSEAGRRAIAAAARARWAKVRAQS